MRKSRSGGSGRAFVRQPPPKLEPCQRCRSDQDFLRSKQRPSLETRSGSLRAADLFAGCGGMSVGMEEAARRVGQHLTVAFAVDADPNVLDIYKRNVNGAAIRSADVAKIFDGDLGEKLTASERKIEAEVGTVSILLGGPPCHGHSDLNNHTRRNDPKNGLYLTMARATEVLKPQFVVIENVVPVQRDQSGVVQLATMALEQAGYSVGGRVLDFWKVGVPQRRRRLEPTCSDYYDGVRVDAAGSGNSDADFSGNAGALTSGNSGRVEQTPSGHRLAVSHSEGREDRQAQTARNPGFTTRRSQSNRGRDTRRRLSPKRSTRRH